MMTVMPSLKLPPLATTRAVYAACLICSGLSFAALFLV